MAVPYGFGDDAKGTARIGCIPGVLLWIIAVISILVAILMAVSARAYPHLNICREESSRCRNPKPV
jgi:hypothetical protein